MLLTIGLIVKNEEKYLRRCLEALTPVLAQVDSELIIADTGSSDHTQEIAKEFTDHVFHFEWCDDFAAARNSVLNRAKGEWYMSIDADEILQNPNELITFFTSGEYKKYGSATMMIRSSNDADAMELGADFNALRLIKRNNNAHYVNAIHEQFATIPVPTKFLNLIVYHYGYMLESREFIEAKMQRNLRILFRALEKTPSDCILYLYICQAYQLLGELEKALEYCEEGFSYAIKQDHVIKYSFFSIRASIYFQSGHYQRVLDIVREYFGAKSVEIGTDLDFHYYKAQSGYNLCRYSDAAESFKAYLKFFLEYKQGLHNTADTLQNTLRFNTDMSYRSAALHLANAYMELNELKNAKASLRSIPIAELLADTINRSGWLEIEFRLMKKLNDFSDIATLFGLPESASIEGLQVHIEKEIHNEAYRELILKEFADFPASSSAYIRLMKLRFDFYNGVIALDHVAQYISEMVEWSPMYADAFYFAVVVCLPLSMLTENIDASDVSRFFYKNGNFHFNDLADQIYMAYNDQAETYEPKTQIWLSSLYYQEMTSEHISDEHILHYFDAYVKSTYASLSALFRSEILQDNSACLLPKQYRIGYYCCQAADALKSGHKTEYVRHLKSTLQLCPELKNVVKFLTEQLSHQVKQAEQRLSEFDAYSAKVKAAIRMLIESGKIHEAAQFIKVFENLVPNDPEIAEYKNRIGTP